MIYFISHKWIIHEDLVGGSRLNLSALELVAQVKAVRFAIDHIFWVEFDHKRCSPIATVQNVNAKAIVACELKMMICDC